MTETKHDQSILEALDWEPACEYSSHITAGDGPAAWAVLLAPLPCGCDEGGIVLWCGGCLEYRRDYIQEVYDDAGHYHPAPETILYAEPLQ